VLAQETVASSRRKRRTSTVIRSTTRTLQERMTRLRRLPSSAGRVKQRHPPRPGPLDTPGPSPYRSSMPLSLRLR
jgi:hypothetical protein